MRKKYFKSLAEARKVCAERQKQDPDIHVWKMPKGSRHAGQYAVCDHLTFINSD